MKMLKLTGNRVAITPLKPTSETTPGGIILLPNQHRSYVSTDDDQQYRVLATGPGRWVKALKKGRPSHFEKPEVMAGDRVLVDLRYGGLLHDFEDGSHWLIVDATKILMKW
jgi:co-chaperonin GroES (HSP10)